MNKILYVYKDGWRVFLRWLWTGEFVSPRISRKKMRQIEEGDLPPWRSPEPQPGAHGHSSKGA